MKLNIKKETVKQIISTIKTDNRYRVRRRANAILYIAKGYKVSEISKILNVGIDAIYSWISNYKELGTDSFYDKKGKGRKSSFSNIDPNAIKQIALNKPSVSIANALIREKFNIFVHKETLRRYLKKLQN